MSNYTIVPSDAGLCRHVRSYDCLGSLLAHLDDADDLATTIPQLLADDAAQEVDIRNREARCYVAKAVRTGT